jgi:serine/threonine protein kinase
MDNVNIDIINHNNSIITTNKIEVYWNTNKNKCVNEFEIVEYINRGLMWTVFKVKRYYKKENEEITYDYYALKRGHIRSLKNMRYYEDDNKKDYFDRVLNEIKIHELLNKCELFPYLYEVLYDKSSEISYNMDNQYIYLVMQYCDLGQIMYAIEKDDFKYYHNYQVLELISKFYLKEYSFLFENDSNKEKVICSSSDKCFDEEDIIDEVHNYFKNKELLLIQNFTFIKKCAKLIFKEIGKGLIYIHSKNIFYNDIKPDNICLKSNNKHENSKEIFSVLLLDFSISEISQNGMLKSVTGTLRFQSPESFQSGFNGRLSDIWSFGILLFVFLTGEFPFDGESELEIQIKTDKCELNLPKFVDEDCTILLKNILNREPEKRPKIDEILLELEKW